LEEFAKKNQLDPRALTDTTNQELIQLKAELEVTVVISLF